MKYLSILLLVSINLVEAQWSNDTRLTYDSSESNFHVNYKRVGTSGDSIHIVWIDSRDGNDEIYYKRSTNGGYNWSSDIRLSHDSSTSNRPGIAVSGYYIHVIWDQNVGSATYVYYTKSSNAGTNWSTPVRLVNYNSDFAYISSSGSYVYAVWVDFRTTWEEIFYKRSTNNGDSWVGDVRLTYSYGYAYEPSITSSDQFVHLAWYDYQGSNNGVFYRRSTDYGETWGAATFLSSVPNISVLPSLSQSGSIVHVVWLHPRGGLGDVYYKRSTDIGVTWGPDVRLSVDTIEVRFPFVKASGSFVHVVWDNYANFRNIYYKRSTNSGLTWEPDTRLTNSISYSGSPNVDVTYSAVHVIWGDNRDGNGEVYYKRNPTGNIVNIKQNELYAPNRFILYQNYPNPFNPITQINFDIPNSSHVKLLIYDLLGREVITLVNQNMQPGSFTVDWDASDYPSGVYFYRLETDGLVETRKMVLIK